MPIGFDLLFHDLRATAVRNMRHRGRFSVMTESRSKATARFPADLTAPTHTQAALQPSYWTTYLAEATGLSALRVPAAMALTNLREHHLARRWMRSSESVPLVV